MIKWITDDAFHMTKIGHSIFCKIERMDAISGCILITMNRSLFKASDPRTSIGAKWLCGFELKIVENRAKTIQVDVVVWPPNLQPRLAKRSVGPRRYREIFNRLEAASIEWMLRNVAA